ncbi:MAG: response regulator [Candidatus Xenobia bacterium]
MMEILQQGGPHELLLVDDERTGPTGFLARYFSLWPLAPTYTVRWIKKAADAVAHLRQQARPTLLVVDLVFEATGELTGDVSPDAAGHLDGFEEMAGLAVAFEAQRAGVVTLLYTGQPPEVVDDAATQRAVSRGWVMGSLPKLFSPRRVERALRALDAAHELATRGRIADVPPFWEAAAITAYVRRLKAEPVSRAADLTPPQLRRLADTFRDALGHPRERGEDPPRLLERLQAEVDFGVTEQDAETCRRLAWLLAPTGGDLAGWLRALDGHAPACWSAAGGFRCTGHHEVTLRTESRGSSGAAVNLNVVALHELLEGMATNRRTWGGGGGTLTIRIAWTPLQVDVYDDGPGMARAAWERFPASAREHGGGATTERWRLFLNRHQARACWIGATVEGSPRAWEGTPGWPPVQRRQPLGGFHVGFSQRDTVGPVLVVEDSDEERARLLQELSGTGVANAAQARAVLEHGAFACVVCDNYLPREHDGLRLLYWLRVRNNPVPFILRTSGEVNALQPIVDALGGTVVSKLAPLPDPPPPHTCDFFRHWPDLADRLQDARYEQLSRLDVGPPQTSDDLRQIYEAVCGPWPDTWDAAIAAAEARTRELSRIFAETVLLERRQG